MISPKLLRWITLDVLLLISVTIYAKDFDCRNQTCHEHTLICDDNEDCFVDCAYPVISDNEACQEADIFCPSNANCIILCDYVEACDRATIHAQNSINLEIICKDHHESCKETTIYCPNNDNILNPLEPTCNIIAKNTINNEIFYGMEIYAINGLNDVSITTSAQIKDNITLYCSADWTYQCTLGVLNECDEQCDLVINNDTNYDYIDPTKNTEMNGIDDTDYVSTEADYIEDTNYVSSSSTNNDNDHTKTVTTNGINDTNYVSTSSTNKDDDPTKSIMMNGMNDTDYVSTLSMNKDEDKTNEKPEKGGILDDLNGNNDLIWYICGVLVFVLCCMISLFVFYLKKINPLSTIRMLSVSNAPSNSTLPSSPISTTEEADKNHTNMVSYDVVVNVNKSTTSYKD